MARLIVRFRTQFVKRIHPGAHRARIGLFKISSLSHVCEEHTYVSEQYIFKIQAEGGVCQNLGIAGKCRRDFTTKSSGFAYTGDDFWKMGFIGPDPQKRGKKEATKNMEKTTRSK